MMLMRRTLPPLVLLAALVGCDGDSDTPDTGFRQRIPPPTRIMDATATSSTTDTGVTNPPVDAGTTNNADAAVADAGVADAGPEMECMPGQSCGCAGGSSCAVSCSGGGCNMNCGSNATCSFSCMGGRCNFNVQSGAMLTGGTNGTCADVRCPGGNCVTMCGLNAICNVDCNGPAGQCSTECLGAKSCIQSCENNCELTCNGVETCEQDCDLLNDSCWCRGCTN